MLAVCASTLYLTASYTETNIIRPKAALTRLKTPASYIAYAITIITTTTTTTPRYLAPLPSPWRRGARPAQAFGRKGNPAEHASAACRQSPAGLPRHPSRQNSPAHPLRSTRIPFKKTTAGFQEYRVVQIIRRISRSWWLQQANGSKKPPNFKTRAVQKKRLF